MIPAMLEQRIQQQFFESADLQYECAETLARDVAVAAQALLNTLTSGGRLLLFGSGAARGLAQQAHNLFVGRFERERPPLAAVWLDAGGNPALAAPQLLALAQPGDALLLFDDPTGGTDPAAAGCVSAAHQREATAVVIARARPATWPERLLETDVLVALPHDRAARVLEAQLLVLHTLADALDHQLLGEQDPA
jgi:D-sedoheptulose 7-phosphate isomerase